MPSLSQEHRIAIIGSGYGGSVAAQSLADKGFRVDLIEMGCDWDAMPQVNGKTFDSMTSPTARSTWFSDRTDVPFSYLAGLPIINRRIDRGAGALGMERFAQMKVYVGRGVGGGSLVNGGMAVTPRKSYFQKVLPQLDADEMYSTYFPRANAQLGVAEPPADILATASYYQFARVAAEQAKKAGYSTVTVPNVYDWDYMRREGIKRETRSALGAEVIYGNNSGKKTLPRTILQAARATGRVTVKPLTEVTRLRRSAGGQYELTLKTIDFHGVVRSEQTQTYDRVILAAGSVGSTRLLLRAQAENLVPGLRDNTDLGQGWGPNGNTMLARRLTWGTATGSLQSGMPAMGISHWNDGPTSVFAEIAPFPTGIEMRTNVYLAITDNDNLAAFTWNKDIQDVELGWTTQMSAPSVNATKAVFDRINAANPGTFYRTDLFEDRKAFTDYFTYHPLGGAVLGEATDLNGEINGAPGLFVLDGSLIPGRIGVNPFVTITAIVQRCMDGLMAAGRFA